MLKSPHLYSMIQTSNVNNIISNYPKVTTSHPPIYPIYHYRGPIGPLPLQYKNKKLYQIMFRSAPCCRTTTSLTLITLTLAVTLKPQSHRIVRFVAIWRTCDRSAMFATIARSGRKLRSVFLARGRSSYDWSYAWSRDQQRL